MNPKRHDGALRLPPLELDCLRALWALGQGTVQQLHTHLLQARPLAYTTVMTVMERLARKEMVSREKRGRAHLYRPLKGIEDFRQSAVSQIVRDFFGGSREALAQYLRDDTASAVLPRTSAPSPNKDAQGRAGAVGAADSRSARTVRPKHARPPRAAAASPTQEAEAKPTTGLAPELL